MPAKEFFNTTLNSIYASATKGYWRLEGNSNDASGNANNGTDTDITYGTGNGRFGQGADFNGSSSKILVNDANSLKITGVVTISAWIFPTSFATLTAIVCKGREASNQMRYSLFVTTGGNAKFRVVAAAGRSHTANTALTLNAWNHVVVTCNINGGSTPTFYINGLLSAITADDTSAATYANVAETNQLGIGAKSDSGNLFTGDLDDIIILDRAITAQEAKDLYFGYVLGEQWNQPSVQARYPLENLNDFSGNDLTLTNNNSVTFGAGRFNNGAVLAKASTTRYLSRADSISIAGTDGISFSCWVKLASEITSSPSRYVFWFIDFATQNINMDCIYEYNGGNLILRWRRSKNGGATDEATKLVALGTSQWHHIAGTWDTTTLRLYLNGGLVGVGAASGTGTNAVTAKFGIGGEGFFPMDGTIDDLVIYKTRVLTPNEIRSYYSWAVGRYSNTL